MQKYEILLVEDIGVNIFLIKGALKKLGLSAEVAINLEEANKKITDIIKKGTETVIILDGAFPGIDESETKSKKIAAEFFLDYLKSITGDFRKRIHILATSSEIENNEKIFSSASRITQNVYNVGKKPNEISKVLGSI